MPFGYEIARAIAPAFIALLFGFPRICEAKVEGLIWAVRGQGHRARTCDTNEEGIEATSIRSGVKSSLHCQAICERRGDCVAADFLPKTQMCLLYDEACLEPQGGGGSSDEVDSFMLVRQFHFAPIANDKACEENNEGIVPFATRDNLMSLEHCFLSCQHRSGCAAVDWFLETGICNFYHAPCNKPLSMQPGAASYKITHITGGQTVWEMKQRAVKSRKQRQSWALTSDKKACRKNAEGIKAFRFGQAPNAHDCRSQCANAFLCEAVDYITPSKMCILYEEPCFVPEDEEKGAESWHVTALPMGTLHRTDALDWKVVSPSKGCMTNKEGVKEFRSYPVRNYRECEMRCEAHKPCLAFDYYRKTKLCALFNEQCKFPLQTGDGASSYSVNREVAPDWGKLSQKEQDEIIAQEGTRAGQLTDEPIEAEKYAGTRPKVTPASLKLLKQKPKDLEKMIVWGIMRDDEEAVKKLLYFDDQISLPRDTIASLVDLARRYEKTKVKKFLKVQVLEFIDYNMAWVVKLVEADNLRDLKTQLERFPLLASMNTNPDDSKKTGPTELENFWEGDQKTPKKLVDIAREKNSLKCLKYLEDEGHSRSWLDEEDIYRSAFDDVDSKYLQIVKMNELASEKQEELEWNRLNKEIFGVDPSEVVAGEDDMYKKSLPNYQEVSAAEFRSMSKDGDKHFTHKFKTSVDGNGTHIMNLSPIDEQKFDDIWSKFSARQSEEDEERLLMKEGFFAMVRATNPDGGWPPDSWFNQQNWEDAATYMHADHKVGITREQLHRSYLLGDKDQHSVAEDWEIIFNNPKNEEQYTAISQPGNLVCPHNIYNDIEKNKDACETRCTENHDCEYYQYSKETQQCRLSEARTCDDTRSSRHFWSAIFKKPHDYHRYGGKRDPDEKMYHDELGDEVDKSSLEPHAVEKMLQDMRNKAAMAEGSRFAKILNDPNQTAQYKSEFIFMGPGHCEDPNNHHLPALGAHVTIEEADKEITGDVLHQCMAYCVFRADCIGYSFRKKNNWCLLFVPDFYEDGWTIDLYGRGRLHEKVFRGYSGPSFGPIATTDTRPGWECYAKAQSDGWRAEVDAAKDRHEEKLKFEREMQEVRKLAKDVLSKNNFSEGVIEDDEGAVTVKMDRNGNPVMVDSQKPYLRREAEEALLDEKMTSGTASTTVNMMALAAKAFQKKKYAAKKQGGGDEYTSWGRGLGEI